MELREWDGKGYVLADRQLFEQAYVVATDQKTTEEAIIAKADNVIIADFTPASEVDLPAQSNVSDPAESEKPAKEKKNSKVEKRLLSVNHSSLEELSTVKGLPKKVAQEIVDKRPHSTWEGLLKLKGIGPKLLKKLSKVLKLN